MDSIKYFGGEKCGFRSDLLGSFKFSGIYRGGDILLIPRRINTQAQVWSTKHCARMPQNVVIEDAPLCCFSGGKPVSSVGIQKSEKKGTSQFLGKKIRYRSVKRLKATERRLHL